MLLEWRQTSIYTSALKTWAIYLYWILGFVSGSVCAVCYAVAFKPDCATVGLLTAAASVLAQQQINKIAIEHREIRLNSIAESNHFLDRKNKIMPIEAIAVESSQQRQSLSSRDAGRPHIRRPIRWIRRGIRLISLPLRPLHAVVCLLNIFGAVTVPLRERFKNPGTTVAVSIPDYGNRVINYYCNAMSVLDSLSKPTIWFESTASHGIVDFLGLQHYLAVDYNFSSCSYDPPNFGWSSRLPAGLKDHSIYLPALIKVLGKHEEQRIHIGWGGGLSYAINHAADDPTHVSAIIDLDAVSPDVEYFDEQQQKGWNNLQTLQFRASDLASKSRKAMTILALGYAW
jgi:hypothetical protein